MFNSRQAFIFNHFKTLISTYDGTLPFHNFLKKYCKLNSSLGSTDRRLLREILYCVFRMGPVWKDKSLEDIFLWPAITNPESELLKKFYTGIELKPEDLEFKYPFENLLMESLRQKEYYESLSKQPLVWVRVDKKNADKFRAKYKEQIIAEEDINRIYIAFGLSNSTAIDNEPYSMEIQDLSSQLVSSKIIVSEGMKVWDCCCGAGGKSLFIAGEFKKLDHFASDVRPVILRTLKERFSKNRLAIPKCSVVDLSEPQGELNFADEEIGYGYFDVIIADVPCSGSGTWAREPENLSFFTEEKIDELVLRQKQIVINALPFLKQGGKLYYITCSVFESENNELVTKLLNENNLVLIKSELVTGYNKGADTLFIAEFTKK